MTETMQRLRERLQTGWQPTAAEIPAEVPQRLMRDWDWWKSGDTLLGFPLDDVGWQEVSVLEATILVDIQPT
jgi:hypothetical protein